MNRKLNLKGCFYSMSNKNLSSEVPLLTKQNKSPQQSEQGLAKGRLEIVPTPPPIKVVIEQASSPYEARDIIAQEEMADAATFMLFAAVASLIVTFIGTLLLWKQVSLTREALQETGSATKAMQMANELAAKTSMLQLRPYVGCVSASLLNYNTPQVVIKFGLKNYGQTPARIFANNFRIKRTSAQLIPGQVGSTIIDVDVGTMGVYEPAADFTLSEDIVGPINVNGGECVYTELTLQYSSLDGTKYWRRVNHKFDQESVSFSGGNHAQISMNLNSAGIEYEDGEGEPPESML
jgi:hypothetical protein